MEKNWEFETLSDVDNFGHITIQRGKILNHKNGLVLLEDGTKTTLKRIRNFLIDPENEVSLWAEYNPVIKKWQKIGNLKTIS